MVYGKFVATLVRREPGETDESSMLYISSGAKNHNKLEKNIPIPPFRDRSTPALTGGSKGFFLIKKVL